MIKRFLRQSKASDWVIYILMAISILASFIIYGSEISLWRGIALVALSLVYVYIAIIGMDFCETRINVSQQVYQWAIWTYFGVQLLLASLIFYLGWGATWLGLLPLSSQTVYLFSRRGILVTNALIVAASMVVIRLMTSEWTALVQSGVAFVAAVVFVVVFTQITVREQDARLEIERLAVELQHANQKLRAYSTQVEELATVQERNRLAREIHDGLGHYLTAINIQIKAAQAVFDSEPRRATEAMSKAQALAQDALADVRRSVAALRADPAQEHPLPETLELLLEQCRTGGLVTDLKIRGAPQPLSPQVVQTLYRVAQEGLTNVRKHSLASRVDLSLSYASDHVRLSIHDNGLGARQVEQGFGLFGLRERVQLLGGKLAIESQTNEGFLLVVELPVGE